MTAQSEQHRAIAGFPVDDCFGIAIGRPPLDGLAQGALDSATAGELVTFEEFIRGAKKRGAVPGPEGIDLRPIDEDDALGDAFFDVALDTARVPEDPPSTRNQPGRAKLYTVQNAQTTVPASAASFRQSFCPTVGEGGRWLGVGGPRRDSQDSAAYGQQDGPPEEPRPATAKFPRMDGARGSASLESLRGTPAIGQAGDEQGQLVRRQRPQSGGNLLLSKFFCCFRTIDANGQRQRCAIGDNNQQQYAIGDGGQCHQVEQQPTKLYSWDTRPEQRDSKELLWHGLAGETRVKEPGQLSGNPFQIEGCSDCVLVLLDQCASLTIDDCRDCVVLCGPCRGSVFLRDCANMLVFAVCQQFRTRDCRQLTAHLFCATCPTVEETDLQVAPLLLNYAGLQTQMHGAGLSPFVNRWNQVHNFTPESGKCHVLQNAQPTANSFNTGLLIHRWNDFLAGGSPIPERLGLSLGKASESRIFVDGQGKGRPVGEGEERLLVLIQPVEGVEPGMRFYAEAVDVTKELLAWGGTKLVAMHDIDLRPGEWETIMMARSSGKGQKDGSSSNKQTCKIVAIECCGPADIAGHAETICARGGLKAAKVQLVDKEQFEQHRKQLYRLCEIRQSI